MNINDVSWFYEKDPNINEKVKLCAFANFAESCVPLHYFMNVDTKGIVHKTIVNNKLKCMKIVITDSLCEHKIITISMRLKQANKT